MTDILIKIAVVVALLAALFFGEQYIEGRGYDRARAEDTAAINKQKAEVATTLATETAKALQAERALSHLKNLQELQDADHQKTVSGLSARLRDFAGPAGRLRDPNAAGCGGGGSGTPGEAAPAPGGRTADPAEAGGLLSKQLTEFLLSQAADADQINLAYTSCRLDALTLREVLR